MHGDTIFALASGGLPSGIAIVRLSGPKAFAIAQGICGTLPEPGRFALRTLRDETNAVIDSGPIVSFKAPNSFTGQDVVEFHVHGSIAVVERLGEVLHERGARAAEAGEFTRRAFENGRLDLTEVEGLGDLIAAETEAQRRLAVAQAGGVLRRLYGSWRDRLLHTRAMIEAELDFADEDDVPDDASASTWREVATLAHEMRDHLASGRDGEVVRDGFRVALLGPPNAGKSSLLNVLSGRDAAIVTPIPGTTRDVVTVEIERKGQRIVLSDTAGLRDSADVVEREGMSRARKLAESADLRIWLSPIDRPEPTPDDLKPALLVRSKDDDGMADGLSVSCRTDGGLDPLLREIDDLLPSVPSGQAVATRARHREGVRTALEHLQMVSRDQPPELSAEHLRAAASALGRVTGQTDVEDLLGVIFSRFCVGK